MNESVNEGAQGLVTETFSDKGDFAALDKAQRWCRERGISYGSMQRDEPIGLMVGDFDIAKWRNLSAKDRRELHGTITGDKRNGPVFVAVLQSAMSTRKSHA
jgi:hypothetical protein